MKRKTRVWALMWVMGLAVAGYAQEAPAAGAPQDGQQQSPAPTTPKPQRVWVGGAVDPPRVISAPPPIYPVLARQARIEGDVVLHAVISKDGDVTDLQVISGHPLLVQAAEDAVRQWKYQTTRLNGDPVEVEMTITVHFVMDKNPPDQQGPPAAQVPVYRAPDGEGPTGENTPLDPQLKADILHLFDVMKVRELMGATMHSMFEDMRPQLLATMPMTPNRDKIVDAYFEKLVAVLKSDEFLNAGAAIYARYLSDDDVKGLTAFYETPAGQHYNAAASRIVAESARLGGQETMKSVPRILKELCDEYPELQGEAKFCPNVAPGQGNQSLLREPEQAPLSGAGR